jgi:hypothetical protein
MEICAYIMCRIREYYVVTGQRMVSRQRNKTRTHVTKALSLHSWYISWWSLVRHQRTDADCKKCWSQSRFESFEQDW